MDAHWTHEQAVFLRFLALAPELRVQPNSIRHGDGYDVACASATGEELAFELTEITDRNWAASMSTLVTVPQLLNQRLREGQDRDAKTVRARYRDRDIAVRLIAGAGPRAVRRVLPRFFAWLAAIDPEVVTQTELPIELRQAIRSVEPRYFPGAN